MDSGEPGAALRASSVFAPFNNVREPFHWRPWFLYNPGDSDHIAAWNAMNQTHRKSLEQVVEEYGRYPLEAFEFVRNGLNHTVEQIHGNVREKPQAVCHVSGRQLCLGLRNYAVVRYGVMARTVLNHWGIHRTSDFGRIVFAMVDSRLMHKTDEDDIRDFDGVYDFETAFRLPERPTSHPQVIFTL
jgi:uncharacterized repeat protein (TIGR04138 family)